jgi:hypothetical protein
MSIDLRSPWTFLLLIPHALRLVGNAESTSDDVAHQIVKEMYGDGPAKLLPIDHPAMPAAIEMAKAQTIMSGAEHVIQLGDDSLGYYWTPPDKSVRTYTIRVVRVVQVEPGTNPKKPFIDYTKPERHGLQVVTIEGDSNADLLRHALRMEEERDKATHAATNANERAEQAEAQAKQVVDRTSTWETEAICVVPRNDQDDMVEILRRRIRTLERENENIREVIAEPDALLRRRMTLESENIKLVQALRAIMCGSEEPGFSSKLIFGLAHAALSSAQQTLFRTGEETITVVDWIKSSTGFLAEIAKQTGAQDHEGECGCEGCGALLLLNHAAQIGIQWPAPEDRREG